MTRFRTPFILVGLVLLFFCASAVATVLAPTPSLASKVFWQPTDAHFPPRGKWHWIGVTGLVVQFGQAGNVTQSVEESRDWYRMLEATNWGQNPWSETLVMGLSGIYQEPEARRAVEELAIKSRRLAAAISEKSTPDAWYFPVEYDPSWTEGEEWADALRDLPRPLAVSAYAGYGTRPQEVAEDLIAKLPNDVTLYWQDGLGTGVRELATSGAVIGALNETFGENRVSIVVEAFRPNDAGDGFREATVWELLEQIRYYQKNFPRNERILFEGMTYLSWPRVLALRIAAQSGLG